MDTKKVGNAKYEPILIIVLVVVGFFGYTLLRQTPNNKASDTLTQPTTSPVDTVVESTAPDLGTTKEFILNSANFSFDVKEIKVKKGDTVKIILNNTEGFHNWAIDEFNASTKTIKAGETDTISFVADKVGSFEYYCSIGQHRAMGMRGNLVVEE